MSVKASPESFWSSTMYAGDCIVWVKHTNHDGYGRLKYRGRLIMAHRLAWILTYGDIRDGFEIDHLCRNRACVNPGHLQSLPASEHTVKGNKGRFGYLFKHNGSGHRVVRNKDGAPVCRTCANQRARCRYTVEASKDRERMNRERRESRHRKQLRDR